MKRQLEEIQLHLDSEKDTTGSLIQKQEKEIEECKKELETKKDSELKLRTRAAELQEELDQTLRRID